jgi:hypothetical protein
MYRSGFLSEHLVWTKAVAGMKSVVVPNTVEKIRKYCFLACKSRFELKFESDSNVKEIGMLSFNGCPLVSVKIPTGFSVKYIYGQMDV